MKKFLFISLLMSTYYLFAQNLVIQYHGPLLNYNLELNNSVAKLQTSQKSQVPILYFDLKNKKHFYQMNKNEVIGFNTPYLIELTNNHQWEITTESKEILGYKCFKATTKIKDSNSVNEIIAWYTPNLPYAIGPTYYSDLPGVVLELLSSDSKNNFKVISIKKDVVKTKIKLPLYTVISNQKFNEILKKNTGTTY